MTHKHVEHTSLHCYVYLKTGDIVKPISVLGYVFVGQVPY